MTESEWLNEKANPQWMVSHVTSGKSGLTRTKAGRRKCRLFACGCCQVVWDLLPTRALQQAVLTAERFADELATKQELAKAHAGIAKLAYRDGPFGESPGEVLVPINMAIAAASDGAGSAAFSMTVWGSLPLGGKLPAKAANAYLCDLLRCIFGNPFRPVAAERAWRTPTVLRLAEGIYESRDFDDLPILGDALEEAGCNDATLLEHCRSDGPHARGCWAVDVAMGRK